MKVMLTDIRPNPFRRLERYPTIQEKVDTLKASIKATGFWDNIVARPTMDGYYELAYGHNRLEALTQLVAEGKDFSEINIIVKDFDDTEIARVMAKQYRTEVGPWVPLLPVLTDHDKPRS